MRFWIETDFLSYLNLCVMTTEGMGRGGLVAKIPTRRLWMKNPISMLLEQFRYHRYKNIDLRPLFLFRKWPCSAFPTTFTHHSWAWAVTTTHCTVVRLHARHCSQMSGDDNVGHAASTADHWTLSVDRAEKPQLPSMNNASAMATKTDSLCCWINEQLTNGLVTWE